MEGMAGPGVGVGEFSRGEGAVVGFPGGDGGQAGAEGEFLGPVTWWPSAKDRCCRPVTWPTSSRRLARCRAGKPGPGVDGTTIPVRELSRFGTGLRGHRSRRAEPHRRHGPGLDHRPGGPPARLRRPDPRPLVMREIVQDYLSYISWAEDSSRPGSHSRTACRPKSRRALSVPDHRP